MQIRKRWLAVAVFTLAVMMMALPAHAVSKSKVYKEYKKWINAGCEDLEGEDMNCNRFALIKIDADDIPELVAYKKPAKGSGRRDMLILSYKNSKLIKMAVSDGVAGGGGFRGSVMYLKKKGLIYENTFNSGNGEVEDTVTKLKKNSFLEIAKGSYQMIDDDTFEDVIWNDKKASKSYYDKKLKKAFNTKKGVDFEDISFISKSKMLKKLK